MRDARNTAQAAARGKNTHKSPFKRFCDLHYTFAHKMILFCAFLGLWAASLAAGGTLRGTVIDSESGAGISFASVLLSLDGEILAETSTDGDGRFAFVELLTAKPGYRLAAKKNRYVSISPTESLHRD